MFFFWISASSPSIIVIYFPFDFLIPTVRDFIFPSFILWDNNPIKFCVS